MVGRARTSEIRCVSGSFWSGEPSGGSLCREKARELSSKRERETERRSMYGDGMRKE